MAGSDREEGPGMVFHDPVSADLIARSRASSRPCMRQTLLLAFNYRRGTTKHILVWFDELPWYVNRPPCYILHHVPAFYSAPANPQATER